MNNVKRKNKIQYWVDCFFIFAPILLLVAWFCFLIFNSIFSGSNLKGYTSGFNYTDLDSLFEFFDNAFTKYFDLNSGFYDSWFDSMIIIYDDESPFYFIINRIDDIFHWFGDNSSFWFIKYYFGYIICYEFLSLFINIILWIPRYIRSWVQEKGVNV